MRKEFKDLTAEQQKNYEAQMKKFGLSPRSEAVYDHARLVAAKRGKAGPVVLSSDEAKSHVKPNYITINSLDEIKSLIGVADNAFESGQRSEAIFDLPPPLPKGKKRKAQAQLTEEERQTINRAAEHYIFGHSKRTRSYKTAFESLRMPMRVAAFASENITVTKDRPYRITGPDPVVLTAGVITMEAGSEIIVETEAHITAQLLQDGS
ncbi:MAG: hypothetical protein P8X90_28275 [Desulfobacterales bacterium]